MLIQDVFASYRFELATILIWMLIFSGAVCFSFFSITALIFYKKNIFSEKMVLTGFLCKYCHFREVCHFREICHSHAGGNPVKKHYNFRVRFLFLTKLVLPSKFVLPVSWFVIPAKAGNPVKKHYNFRVRFFKFFKE